LPQERKAIQYGGHFTETIS